jgi:DNA-binding NtrC family response regulator
MKKFKEKILIVDDEEGMCKLLKTILEEEGYDITVNRSAIHGIEMIKNEDFDLAIVDIKMPEMDGIEFLKKGLEINPRLNFIMISAYGNIKNAVDSIKIGAFNYITKPFDKDEIKVSVEKALEHGNLINENIWMKRELDKFQNIGNAKFTSRVMSDIFSFARKIADSQLSVLITGESGTGKEVIARYIHDCSIRKEKPFIPVQCSLLPVSLLESELFGFKKGAFTGANENRMGLFEQANNGTIFLDEIGDTSLDTQGKLLRFLQEREIRRIGDTKSIVLDVRLIFATNKNIENLIKEKEFRDDLYYRMKVLTIHMPPLRERKEDIPLLVQYFIEEENLRRTDPVEIENNTLKQLIEYNWPGNVRELKNCIESAAAICESRIIRPSDISSIKTNRDKQHITNTGFKESKNLLIEDFEKNYLTDMMHKYRGGISSASRAAQIDRKTFGQLLKKYGIEPENFK